MKDNTMKVPGILRGITVLLMLGCLAAKNGTDFCVLLFALAAGCDFYTRAKETENLTGLISREILGIYIRYWPVLLLAMIASFVLKMLRAEHFIADSIYCFLGLRFTCCAAWHYLPAFVLVLASAPGLLRMADRKASAAAVLFLVLFSAFVYFALPKIMSGKLFSVLAVSLLWKSLYTALWLLPAFFTGCLLVKHGFPQKIEAKRDSAAGLGKALSYIGQRWLSIWLISTFLCKSLGESVFSRGSSVVVFLLLFAVSTLCAGLLEALEKKIVSLFE